MTTETTAALDEERMGAFVGQVLGELGSTLNAALVVTGDRLGLYKAMAGAGPLTPAELADRTGTSERYVREWLNAQAAGGYVTYDGATQRYALPPEQAVALADETSPYFLPGAFEFMAAIVRDEPSIREAFRSGAGVGWHEHSDGVFEGCERFFRPGYAAGLVPSWIPALDGVEAKLRARRDRGRRRLRARRLHHPHGARRTPPRRSWASTTTAPRSSGRAGGRATPACRDASASRRRRPRATRAPATTS